jgi:hypothetical protein
MPIIYGDASDFARTTFMTAPKFARPLGVSPFGTFWIDFSVLDALSAPSGFDGPTPATEIVLLMELDSKEVDGPLTWIPVCQPTQGGKAAPESPPILLPPPSETE